MYNEKKEKKKTLNFYLIVKFGPQNQLFLTNIID